MEYLLTLTDPSDSGRGEAAGSGSSVMTDATAEADPYGTTATGTGMPHYAP
jgi:hypothetical protein